MYNFINSICDAPKIVLRSELTEMMNKRYQEKTGDDNWLSVNLRKPIPLENTFDFGLIERSGTMIDERAFNDPLDN